jgi:hypothetical protein
MTTDLGVLLPVRIETRFKNGDLWVRVIPDDPWFIRSDERITPAELAALRRYAEARTVAGVDPATPPAPWRDLAAAVGAPRAVFLVRVFVSVSADGSTLTVPDPDPEQLRDGPVLPRIQGFPATLQIWVDDDAGLHSVHELNVKSERLLADFADPADPGDRRWWEDWDEAVNAGVACVIPAAQLTGGVSALYVIGLGDGDPADLFADLAAEGRMGLLAPGQPTNSVDGAAAASLATDAASWWAVLTGARGPGDTDVSAALTGDPGRLANLPGGERAHRGPASALTTALWPALWGFAAGQVFDIARGPDPAAWAASAMFPEGPFPSVRIGPQPYGLMPVTAWSAWQPADGDSALEPPLAKALVPLRARLARQARARGTAIGTSTDDLLDLIADTPSSGHFRYRQAWPLELWWMSSVGSALPATWRDFDQGWRHRHPLVQDLAVTPLRRYGTRGPSRRTELPLVVPSGATAADLPGMLSALADAARTTPARFANTSVVEKVVLGGRGDSLLLRLVIRSLQLLIGDLVRERDGRLAFDPEPLIRSATAAGRLEQLITAAQPDAPAGPGSTTTPGTAAQLKTVRDALHALADIPVPELERMLRSAIDSSSHRVDPWLLAIPQRRLDAQMAAGAATRRLGAYGWVDRPAPGTPGPTPAGVVHAPTVPAAMTAAILRDRAISDASPRWHLTIDSRTARAAEHLASQVRAGAHLHEVMGREVERIVGRPELIAALRRSFPIRSEHAGRRTCDGVKVLAEQPFPVDVGADQAVALAVLRDSLDCYADLLVADAVHHLVEGRAETAGQVMDAAAGLSRPPELALLSTARSGRTVSSTVVLALPHVAGPALPAAQAQRALLSPATVLDPSMVAAISASTGNTATWDFVVGPGTTGPGTIGPDQPVTVTLGDLGLTPADALSLTLSTLQRLAADHAGRPGADVVGGTGPARYEQVAAFVGLVGRDPAQARSLSENRSAIAPGEAADPEIVTRYLSARSVGQALSAELTQQVEQFGSGDPDGLGGADATRIQVLLRAATAWGIAPDAGQGLPFAARTALQLLQARLASAPDEATAAQLSRERLSSAAAALISPTGQAGLSATVPASMIPRLTTAPALDDDWLTVVAAVRPALAQLESHQLGSGHPLTSWANRATDPWQTDATDDRPLVAVYAPSGLDLGASPPGSLVAATVLDHVDEVIPAADQTSGAAFGFRAPRARAQQAILLAVPPVPNQPLDPATLAQILRETRELAHARMARPADLDPELLGLFPTGLMPAAGSLQIPLEVHP